MTTEPWVSVDEVAKHLDVVKDSVYRWIESRHLPAHRIGRILKFRLSEIDAWVRSHSAGSIADQPGCNQENTKNNPDGGL